MTDAAPICDCGLHNDRETTCTCDGRYRSAATSPGVERRFAVVVCPDCSCQLGTLDDGNYICGCCEVAFTNAEARRVTVIAIVPFARAEA